MRFLCIVAWIVASWCLTDAGRRVETQRHRDVIRIEEVLNEISTELESMGMKRVRQYHLETHSLLILIEELDQLHQESIHLIFLLLDDNSKDCKSYLDHVNQEITTSVDSVTNAFQFEIVLNTTDLDIEGTRKVTEELEHLSNQLFDMSINLLETTKKSFNTTIEDLVKTKDLYDATEYLSEEDVTIYYNKIRTRLSDLEKHVERTIRINRDQIVANHEEQRRITFNISNIRHSLRYGSQSQCQIVKVEGTSDQVTPFLSKTNIDDLFIALRAINNDILEFQAKEKFFDWSVRHEVIAGLVDLKSRVEIAIQKVEIFYDQDHRKQIQLFEEIRGALAGSNVDAVDEVHLEFLHEVQEAEEFILKVWNKTRGDEEKTLRYAKRILHFPTAVKALQAFVYCSGGGNPRLLNLIAGELQRRYRTGFNNELYGDAVTLYLNDLYKYEWYFAQQMILRLMHNLATKRFIHNTSEYWLADVVLFLDSNLQMILRQACNPEVYYTIDYQLKHRIFRKLISYVEVVRVVRDPDLDLLRKSKILKHYVKVFKAVYRDFTFPDPFCQYNDEAVATLKMQVTRDAFSRPN